MFAIIVLGLFAVFGGREVDDGLRTLVLGLVAAISLARAPAVLSERSSTGVLFALAAAWTGLGLLHLMPIWSGLLPRSAVQNGVSQVIALVGSQREAILTVDRDSTVLWLIASLVPPAGLVLGAQLAPHQQVHLLWTVAAIAIPSLIVAAIQIGSGGEYLNFYEVRRAAEGTGQFVNRNHLSTLIAISLSAAMCAVWTSIRPGIGRRLIVAGLTLFGPVAALGLGSRMGMALSLAGALTTLLLLTREAGEKNRAWPKVAVGLTMLAGLTMIASAVGQTHAARFTKVAADARWDIWTNSWAVARENLPFGTGMGSFVKAYAASEPVATLMPYYINRAHNDYLEVLLEGGVPALLLLVLYVLVVGRALQQSRRAGRLPAAQVFALVSLLIYLVHSLLDYPLRYPLHMLILGLATAMLCAPRRVPGTAVGGRPPTSGSEE